jgi:hypothetical protein
MEHFMKLDKYVAAIFCLLGFISATWNIGLGIYFQTIAIMFTISNLRGFK